MNRLQFHLAFVFLLLMALPVDLIGQGGSAPVIVSATVQYEPNIPWQLTISGRNFKPSGTNPTIYFGSVQLTSPAASDILIEATVPPTAPGTYLLSVTNSKKVTGTAYVTIGAVGPTGGMDQSIELTVDCTKQGGSVIAALDQAGPRVGRTTVNIIGFCNEDVNIERSNITIRAADGSPDAGFNKLNLNLGAHEIRIENLRIAHGLAATDGATFRAENLRVDQPDWGNVSVTNSASGILINPTLTNCYNNGFCIGVEAGGHLWVIGGETDTIGVLYGGTANISETVIRKGLGVDSGGSAYVDRATIETGSGTGVSVKGNVTLFQTTISNNASGGVSVEPGGIVDIRGGTKILNNGVVGIGIRPSGIAHITDSEISGNDIGILAKSGALVAEGATISNNKGRGIEARGTSTLKLRDSKVENNLSDGIWLEDLSFMVAEDGLTYVRNNTGWGLHCSTEPIAVHYRDYSVLSVTDNGPQEARTNISCETTP